MNSIDPQKNVMNSSSFTQSHEKKVNSRFREKCDAVVCFVHYAVEAVLDWAIKPNPAFANRLCF